MTELQPDLLFLDVQMPKLDGFEVLELLGRDVPVVFMTAYDQYALRAFEVHAVDYLLKPFSEERFAEALSRARERLAARGEAIRRSTRWSRGAAARRARSSACSSATARRCTCCRSSGSTTSRRRTTTSASRSDGQAVPEGSDAGGGRRRRSIPRASSASTARTC